MKIAAASFRVVVMAVFAALLIILIPSAYATDCSTQQLKDAIFSANATSSDETINLSGDCVYTLTKIDDETPEKLPVIASAATSGKLTINGNGATITRNSDLNFRLFEVASGGNLTLNNLILSNGKDGSNTAFGHAGGGAIYSDHAIVTVTNTVFSGNLAPGSLNTGGAINNDGGTLTVTSSTFTNNSAPYAGAINSSGPTTINNSSFNTNSADYGGSVIFSGATGTITNSIFNGNHATYWAGAVYVLNGDFFISNSTFNGNSADDGGGIVVNMFTGLTVTNSTIYGNSSMSIGGGVDNKGNLKLGNSIVASNTSPSGPNIKNTVNSLGWNAIGSTSGATITGTTTGNLLNAAASPLNLGVLANNGGSTQTMSLSIGSVAIGKGNCSTLSGVPAVTTDQRGNSRKSPCDIGAFETPPNAASHLNRIGLYNPSNALWLERYHLTTGSTSDATFLYGGISGGIAFAGDWNNDNVDSPGMYVPSTAYWFLRNTNTTGTGDITFVFGGISGALPIVGDWNGDGTDTVGLYLPSTGQWLLKNTNATGSGNPDISFVFGPISGGVPIVGDWDGDGIDTPGFYVPSTGLWVEHSANTSAGTDTTLIYGGISGGLPLVGDWNGDGIDSPGMYVPSTAYWFFRNTNTTGVGDITMVYGGIAGALPVVGHWNNSIVASLAQVEPHQANVLAPTEEATESPTAEATAEATDSRQRNTQFTPEATEASTAEATELQTAPTEQVTDEVTPESTEPVVVVPTASATASAVEPPTALPFPTLPVNPPGDTTLPTPIATDQVTAEVTDQALPTALSFPTLPPPASPTDIPTAQSFPTLPSPVTPTASATASAVEPPTLAPVSPPVSDPLDDGAPNWAHTSGWTLAPHGNGLAWIMTSASTSETLLWQTAIDLREAQPKVSLSFASFFAGTGFATVQISTDNGANWTAIAAVSPSNDWSTVTVDLSAYTGNVIQIEFVWQANDTSVNQWGIDDVSVTKLNEVQPTPSDTPTLNPTDTPITTEVPAPTSLATEPSSTEAAS